MGEMVEAVGGRELKPGDSYFVRVTWREGRDTVYYDSPCTTTKGAKLWGIRKFRRQYPGAGKVRMTVFYVSRALPLAALDAP